jgi:hypothetical protein
VEATFFKSSFLRFGLSALSGVALVHCSSAPAPSAAPAATHPVHRVVSTFDGAFDAQSRQLTIVHHLGSREVRTEAVLPYGTAPDQVYFHTQHVQWEGACGPTTLCADVTAVNDLRSYVADFTAVFDSFSRADVTAVGAPYNYGGVDNGFPSDVIVWSFSDPTGANFTFRGHAEGTVDDPNAVLSATPTSLSLGAMPVGKAGASGLEGGSAQVTIENASSGGPSGALSVTQAGSPEIVRGDSSCDGAIAWTNRASMFPAGARSALLLATGSDAPRAVVPGETLATGVAISAGFVYWTSRDVSGGILVERAALTGGAAETVTTLAALADPAGIAVDAAYVYFVGSGAAAAVARAPLAGGIAEVLLDDPGARLVDVLVVGSALYVTDGAGTILTLPKVGGPSQAVATGQASPSHLARDATRVYWTNEATDGAVMAFPIAPVAGDAPAVLAAHLDRPSAIAVDDAIYFTTFDAVMRLAK